MGCGTASALGHDENVLKHEKNDWDTCGGTVFESCLSSGAIALLDADWIIQQAESNGVLDRRQALEDAAFVTLDELKAAGCLQGNITRTLPIVMLSYMWLMPNHPDPRGAHLQLLGRIFKAMLSYYRVKRKQTGIRVGCFWDWASLHQHPPLGLRTPEEDALFRQGLQVLAILYAQPYTRVFRITQFPAGYPSSYELAPGANVAAYSDRGWCFAEQCWSSLVKLGNLSLDLGAIDHDVEEATMTWDTIVRTCTQGHRPPPLAPPQFAAHLEEKTFTNGKDDELLVRTLYAAHFVEQFSNVVVLNFSYLSWGNAEVVQLVSVLKIVSMLAMTTLRLDGNPDVGVLGLAALSEFVASGAVPSLQTLHVDIYDDESAAHLAAACDARGVQAWFRRKWLSNMWDRHPYMSEDGVKFKTAEHHFQYRKACHFGFLEQAKKIVEASTPEDAHELGASGLPLEPQMLSEWEQVKCGHMKAVYLEKFKHPEMRRLLLENDVAVRSPSVKSSLSFASNCYPAGYGEVLLEVLMELRES